MNTRYVHYCRAHNFIETIHFNLMKILLENIKELVQVVKEPLLFRAGSDMKNITTIKNAFLIIRDEIIEEFGRMDQLKDKYIDDDLLIEIDCSNRLVYPH